MDLKSVLFIIPYFFDYAYIISEFLQKKGFLVDVYDRNTFNEENLENVLKKNTLYNYDYVLCIGGGMISLDYLRCLKSHLKKAYFIFYNWDDVVSNPSVVKGYCLFDKCCTYSIHDYSLDNQLQFVPFFFVDYKINTTKKYDLSFIGTSHSDRLYQIQKLKRNNVHLKMFLHIYSPASIYLLKPKYLYAFAQNILSIRKIPYRRMMYIYSKSKACIELPSLHQTAPTTRAIECLGTKTKIITTCTQIQDYDFYNPNNILIVNRNTINIDMDWLNSPYQELKEKIVSHYSLDAWFNKIFTKN